MTISISLPKPHAAWYFFLCLEGGKSTSANHWSFGRVKISGSKDGLPSDSASWPDEYGNNNNNNNHQMMLPMTRATGATARTFTPTSTISVRVAVYSRTGQLIGVMKVRDPTRQRGILERRLALLQIQDYSELIWSVTLPYNWVDEGNVVLIGCVDDRRPTELLVHRFELRNLAHFSEHTITRAKLPSSGANCK